MEEISEILPDNKAGGEELEADDEVGESVGLVEGDGSGNGSHKESLNEAV